MDFHSLATRVLSTLKIVFIFFRYSDFLVHELTPKGDVVQLKNYSIPFEDSEVILVTFAAKRVCQIGRN